MSSSASKRHAENTLGMDQWLRSKAIGSRFQVTYQVAAEGMNIAPGEAKAALEALVRIQGSGVALSPRTRGSRPGTEYEFVQPGEYPEELTRMKASLRNGPPEPKPRTETTVAKNKGRSRPGARRYQGNLTEDVLAWHRQPEHAGKKHTNRELHDALGAEISSINYAHTSLVGKGKLRRELNGVTNYFTLVSDGLSAADKALTGSLRDRMTDVTRRGKEMAEELPPEVITATREGTVLRSPNQVLSEFADTTDPLTEPTSDQLLGALKAAEMQPAQIGTARMLAEAARNDKPDAEGSFTLEHGDEALFRLAHVTKEGRLVIQNMNPPYGLYLLEEF